MELMPGYKETDVGIIPEDWNVASLVSVALANGLVRGPFGGALKKEYFVRDGYKVYEQRNAIYASADIGTYFIDEDKHRELIRFDVKPGDFIVSCSGTIGCIYRIPQGAPKGVINQALLKISLDDQIIDPYYFLITFQSAAFQERIKENTHGGAMQNLVGMDIFRQAPLPLPTEPEQKAISTAIRDAEALLNGLDRLIAKKRDLKRAAMQQLLTGKTRLPGFEEEWKPLNMAQGSTLKARIGWQGLTTAEYLESGQYALVTGTDFFNGKIDWDGCHFVEKERYDQDRYIQLQINDVLLTKDGTIGKAAFVDNMPYPTTLNSGVFVIRPKNGSYVPKYFFYVLRSQIFVDFLNKLQAGSTISHLYQKDFVNFEFLAPATVEEQSAIATVLSDMDAEIASLEQRRNKTNDIKQAMMQELLTGKIRLVTPVDQAHNVEIA